MVNITTSGNSISFQFENSPFYLYGDGEMTFPLNSLLMILDESNMVTFKNQSNDIVVSTTLNELGKSKDEMIALYEEAFVGAEGISPEEVQELIDESISGIVADVATVSGDVATVSGDVVSISSSLSSHTENTDIHVTSADKTAWDAKLDSSALTAYSTTVEMVAAIDSATSGLVATSTLTTNYYDKESIDTAQEVIAFSLIEINEVLSGKADSSGVTAEITAAVSGKADSSAVTTEITAAVSGKAEQSDLQTLSGDVSTISGTVATHTTQLGGLSLVKCTQAEYDALVQGGMVDQDTLYVIVN